VPSDTTSLSDKNHESGLWLWHGETPPPPSPPGPASRVQQFLDPLVSAFRRGGWIALPSGVALALLALMLRSTPPDKPVPADMRVMALAPLPSPADTNSPTPAPRVDIPGPPADIPGPRADIPEPRVEHTDTQLDQTQMPSAPAALLPAQGTEHQLSKKRKTTHRTPDRTVRKPRPLADSGSPFSIRGVLTPPEPTVRRGGGY
jgi:hypothetical protein